MTRIEPTLLCCLSSLYVKTTTQKNKSMQDPCELKKLSALYTVVLPSCLGWFMLPSLSSSIYIYTHMP